MAEEKMKLIPKERNYSITVIIGGFVLGILLQILINWSAESSWIASSIVWTYGMLNLSLAQTHNKLLEEIRKKK